MRTIPLLLAALSLTALVAPAADEGPTKADYKQATGSLKRIGLAFHNYESAYGYFPGNVESKDGKPLLSWRVAILPYMEDDDAKLARAFKLDEPWDSAHNKALVAKLPKVYTPVRAKAKEGETFYKRFSGKDTPLVAGQKLKITGFTDGLSNTGLVFEAGDPVIWTKPDDLPYDPKKLPKLGAQFDGQCHVLLGDGSVIRMKRDPDAAELRKLIQPADGAPIVFDKLTK